MRGFLPRSRTALAVASLFVMLSTLLAPMAIAPAAAEAQRPCRDRLTATVLGQIDRPSCPPPLRNPIGNRADPFLLVDQGKVYLYNTRTATHRLPVTHDGADGPLTTTDALASIPDWSDDAQIWAPSVVRIGNRYVLYYATRHVFSGLQCVSRVQGDSPTGPFYDNSTAPLVCQYERGGSIDPSIVRDDAGGLHLLYKNDGNCCDHPVALFSQPLRANGLELNGGAVELLRAAGGWEGGLIEGPSMVALPGRGYLLAYSANRFRSTDYATGFALCTSVRGPCRRVAGPWRVIEPAIAGIGGLEFTDLPGNRIALTYHGWRPGVVGINGGRATRLGLTVDRGELFCAVAVRVCREEAAQRTVSGVVVERTIAYDDS